MNCWHPGRSLRLIIIAAGLALSLPALAAAGCKVDLNGSWLFRIDAKSEGEKPGWSRTVPEGTEQVSVPHIWNIGKYDDDEGIAWYFRTFEQKLEGNWTADSSQLRLTLRLFLTNPRGETESERQVHYLFPISSGQQIQDMKLPNLPE